MPIKQEGEENAKSKATRKASSRGLSLVLHTIQDKEGKEVRVQSWRIPGQPDAFWGTRQIKFLSSYTLADVIDYKKVTLQNVESTQ